MFKFLKQINRIGTMKKINKPNWNICMDEHLMIPKNLRDKRVTLMNNNLDICGACHHKTTFPRFLLITNDPITEWKG